MLWQNMLENVINYRNATTILGRPVPATVAEMEEKEESDLLRTNVIEGSICDIINAAMVKVAHHPELKALGWKIVLQIHDELILEGP
jgi:DNA polymerase I-like protein with 3'-5' exonuclease and polymerase domains